jgi:hypothetical protein
VEQIHNVSGAEGIVVNASVGAKEDTSLTGRWQMVHANAIDVKEYALMVENE